MNIVMIREFDFKIDYKLWYRLGLYIYLIDFR